MNNWFEVKVNYEKTQTNGLEKKVTESYLVDALSHAEAEARATEELKPHIKGDFVVASVRRANIAELFLDDGGDRYYKAKVQFITLDEKSGAEKRTTVSMLAQGYDIDNALVVLKNGMRGTIADYVITGIAETPIMDIFVYGKA